MRLVSKLIPSKWRRVLKSSTPLSKSYGHRVVVIEGVIAIAVPRHSHQSSPMRARLFLTIPTGTR